MIDVNVCYANCDRVEVEVLVKILESNNIHCWHDVNFQIGGQGMTTTISAYFSWHDRLMNIINGSVK